MAVAGTLQNLLVLGSAFPSSCSELTALDEFTGKRNSQGFGGEKGWGWDGTVQPCLQWAACRGLFAGMLSELGQSLPPLSGTMAFRAAVPSRIMRLNPVLRKCNGANTHFGLVY